MSEAAAPVPGTGLPTTRPAVASRKARRPAGGARKVTRYTLDLEAEQHKFLRLWSIQHEVSASKCMRALLFLLEAGNDLPAGVTLSELVLSEIFDEDEAPEDEAAEEAAEEAAVQGEAADVEAAPHIDASQAAGPVAPTVTPHVEPLPSSLH